jgi:thiol-disulfide isomerase/thioredoxin
MDWLQRASVAIWAACAAVALAVGCSGDKDPDDALTATAAEAVLRGEEITEQMLAAYRKARRYSDRAVYVQQSAHRSDGVERQQPFFTMSLAFERPNKLRLKFAEAKAAGAEPKGYDVASNGALERATMAEIPGQVQEGPAPATITLDNLFPDPLIEQSLAGHALADVFPQLAMLLNVDDAGVVFPHDERPTLEGIEPLRGRKCYRVSTTSPAGKRTFWIDADTHLLHRMQLPIESQRAQLDAANQYARLAVWIDFEDVSVDAEINPDAFDLPVPAGAVRVSHFAAPPPARPDERLGKPLNIVALRSLADETPVDFSGKTTLLSFWQLDCPGCKLHAPELAQISENLADQDDAVCYAVNIDGVRAPAEVLQRTFAAWGGGMPILRPADDSSLESLGIAGTPTLMLLDAEGRLQHLHLGPIESAAAVQKLVEKVRDGADLAAEAQAEHEKSVEEFQKRLADVTIADAGESAGQASQ